MIHFYKGAQVRDEVVSLHEYYRWPVVTVSDEGFLLTKIRLFQTKMPFSLT